MLRRRPFLLVLALILVSALLLALEKIFEYSAAPAKEKLSDFVFPPSPDQQTPIAPPAEGEAPAIAFKQRGGFTNDASHLNKTAVYGIVRIASEDDVRNALQFARERNLKVTCAGQQHSMGGQTFTHGGLVLDLRELNRIDVDRANKRINVQTGARWWQVQQKLDQVGLSVKSMQSINIFSVGGTLSVNAHGIDPAPGPIAPTVRSLRIMLSSGDVVRASPTDNAELFSHALGGYGLFGVILDAELDVVENEMYTRATSYLDFKDYPNYYKEKIEGKQGVGLVFGRLSVAPETYLRETAVHIFGKTQFSDPLPALVPPQHETLERFVINFSKTGDTGRRLRWTLEKNAEPFFEGCFTRTQATSQQRDDCLVSRNQEMYDDMAYLDNRLRDTDILQEYFVPYDRMPEFVDGLRNVVQRNGANLLNVTIRTVHKDTVTALPYATQDMFGFVLYFNVKFNDRDNEILRKTTTDLIDVSQSAGGTFYLPYQLFYSPEQLRRSYPGIDAFWAAKRKYDPLGLFTNKFHQKYGL